MSPELRKPKENTTSCNVRPERQQHVEGLPFRRVATDAVAGFASDIDRRRARRFIRETSLPILGVPFGANLLSLRVFSATDCGIGHPALPGLLIN